MTSPITVTYPDDASLPAGYVHGDIYTLTVTNLTENAANYNTNIYVYKGQTYEQSYSYDIPTSGTTTISGSITVDKIQGTVTGGLASSFGAGFHFTPYNSASDFPQALDQETDIFGTDSEDIVNLHDHQQPTNGVNVNAADVNIRFVGNLVSSVEIGTNMADYFVAVAANESAGAGEMVGADGYSFDSETVSLLGGVTPVIAGTSSQTINAGSAINPFSSITVTDANAGKETLTISFAGADGTLTGGGFTGSGGVYTVQASSAAEAQADLRAAMFTTTSGQAATTTFTISVADGSATTTDATTSVIAAYTAPTSGSGGGSGGTGGSGDGSGSGGSAGAGGSASSSPPSVTTGFTTVETPNALRALSSGADALTTGTPIYAQEQASKAIAAQLDSGQMTQAQAELALAHVVDGTTSVAVADYAFFTGFTPTAAGLDYLVHSTANATDLNDAYYAQFSTENRYINFAVNLATGPGAGAAAFQAAYGSLSLSDATAKAYAAVFGAPADATKVSALLDTLVPDGLGGQETRAQYFAQYGGDGPNGEGTKAAMVGFLLANAVETGAGVYGAADIHYVEALAHGSAPAMGSELALTYGAPVNLVGFTPTPDPTVTG